LVSFGDFRQMKVHRLGIAGRQDQGCALALLRTDGTEDVGRGGPLITGRTRARTALRPPSGDLVLLANARLIREPDFYLVAVNRRFAGNFIQARWEVFLKSSIAPCAWLATQCLIPIACRPPPRRCPLVEATPRCGWQGLNPTLVPPTWHG
jgi:hypothetical protein